MSLEIICPDRWGAESTVRAPGGLVFVSRMTVVRLPDGRLWLSSPVEIDAARQRALREIGPVAFIVAPNGFHHLYAMPAKATFPDATLWASPAFRRRKHPVTPDHWLGDATPPWSSTPADRGPLRGVAAIEIHGQHLAVTDRVSRTPALASERTKDGGVHRGTPPSSLGACLRTPVSADDLL